jgi:hypothetical protein
MPARKVEIDEAELTKLASFGLTQAECAVILGCSPDTIQRRYAEAYFEGLENAKSSLRRKQFELAVAGNVTMLIWLGKNLLGQSDKQEITGKGGDPLFAPVDREELIGKLLGSGTAEVKPTVQ